MAIQSGRHGVLIIVTDLLVLVFLKLIIQELPMQA